MSGFVSVADVLRVFAEPERVQVREIARRLNVCQETAGDLRRLAAKRRRIAALRAEYGFSEAEAEDFAAMTQRRWRVCS